MPRISQRAIDAVRVLSADAVQNANSGHPGAPMGMAEMAAALWSEHLNHNPTNPDWMNRDRFILSNGHASMLLYSVLHLTGYDLSIEDLKQFRQFHSKTPGHPEYGITPGVETTTGPLGQGIANAVGMAIAEKNLAQTFNRDSYPIIDHHTYVFLGDGCLMEGISHEVCSLAGTLKLGKLICLYDDNQISIDGNVSGWFGEDVAKRFEAYGWQVIKQVDGHDIADVSAAIGLAKSCHDQPTLICCKTQIGKGAPNKAGTSGVHGAPLGADELKAFKEQIGWQEPPFSVPADVYQAWDAKASGQEKEAKWQQMFDRYAKQYPGQAAELKRRLSNTLPENWKAIVCDAIETVLQKAETVASRKASQQSIQLLGNYLPEFFGGSADLTESNLTAWSGTKAMTATQGGNYLHYGVREFGMCAIQNGMSAYGGFIPYGGTFLTFSDYERNAIRMAALMKLRSIMVLTHDSIGLGEDGPTHQAVEHAACLRYIPNNEVWRPADTLETFAAWVSAIERVDGPTCLLLSRQNLPFVSGHQKNIKQIEKGGYILSEGSKEKLDLVLIATGSEVGLALEAQDKLQQAGNSVRVVSMPCTNRFDKQTTEYQQEVLPRAVPKMAIEAATADFWTKYVGLDGKVIGMTTFGESAPAGVLFKHFGFTVDHLVEQAKTLIP